MNADVYIYFGVFMLCLVRVVTFFVQAPIWGSHHMPNQALVGIATLVTIVIYPTVPMPRDFPADIMGLAFAILTQAVVGLVIGFVSFLVMAAAQFAGEMIDIQTGLSTAASFDPASKGAVNLIRRLKFYMAMIIYLLLDGHHSLLRALQYSFTAIPLNEINISGSLVSELVRMVGVVFYAGLQIAAPAMAALFVTQVALGMLARVAPQMNVFMLSFPLNIAVGLMLVTVSLPIVYIALQNMFVQNDLDVMNAIRMMGLRR
jgi:flagellar biosynthetic protein FliR